MTSPVITLSPDTRVPMATVSVMFDGFTAAPVMDADGQLIGIATEADLVRSPIVRTGR